MSEDDLYELAEPDDEPTPPPTTARKPAGETAPRPIELEEPAPERPAAQEKRPPLDPSRTDETPSASDSANEPLSVSPAKARLAREDQRKRAAIELAEADARKQKLILTAVGAVVGLGVLLWLWFKLF